MDITRSVNDVPVRLNYERWYHIVDHDEMASYYHDVLETIGDRPSSSAEITVPSRQRAPLENKNS
jgi:hypothetical protein